MLMVGFVSHLSLNFIRLEREHGSRKAHKSRAYRPFSPRRTSIAHVLRFVRGESPGNIDSQVASDCPKSLRLVSRAFRLRRTRSTTADYTDV